MGAPRTRSRDTGARLTFHRLLFVPALMWCVSLHAEPVTFSTADRVLLAEYRALGRAQAPLLIATAPERTRAVALALEKSGAQVIGQRDVIGYLYALVPLQSMPMVLSMKGVQAAQVASNPVRARMGAEPEASQAAAPRSKSKGPAPSAALTPDNPYTGEAATQALDFKARHPTFDGRGVVTAFVEPVAPGLESMRGALNLSGQPLPKFARYELMPADAAEDAVAGTKMQLFVWQKTEPVKPTADGTFTWRGRTYRLPPGDAASTEWRICRRLKNFLMEDHDILWAKNRDRVWALPVTADADFSKAPTASLRNPLAWTPVAAAAPNGMSAKALLFKVDRQRSWLAVVPTLSGHGGMVGSVMAGSKLMDSNANGIAPAAQISIYLSPRVPNAQTLDGHEQMLEMLSDPTVDVAQASHAVGDTSRFGTASIQSIWANRIITRNGKPFIKAGGNFGPQLQGSSEFEMAESVFAVGAYTPRPTWRANFGIEPAAEDTLPSYSGWGPAADGGLKPDFLALTHTLSEIGMPSWYWEGDTRGYGVSGGTSASAPNGAGHVALLVSAAKQTGVPHDAFRLRAAITTTARFLQGVEARAQGHGLIQVSDAWDALQRARKWSPPAFEVHAPLVGAEPGIQPLTGRGLFELSGWKPGQNGRRELTVTRKSGATDASRYLLRWKGHTDAFRSGLQEVDLPLGKPVSIPVDIQVGSSGSYSAILDLIDSSVQLVAGSILNTVMVADTLTPDGEGLRYERESPRPGSSLFYVDVPAGLAALTVSLTKDGGNSFWIATDPTGRMLPFVPYGTEIYRFNADALKRREQQFAYVDPVPGVWQFSMRNAEPRSMADYEAVEDWSQPVPLKVHIQGWMRHEGEPAAVRASQPVDARLRAAPGATGAQVEPLGVGAVRDASTTLRAGLEPTFFDVQVEPGTKTLNVEIYHTAPRARVGLYVFKAPEGERIASTLNSDDTMLIYYDSSLQQYKRYTLDAPPSGRYRVALDPIDVPREGVEVRYRDVVHHPLFGKINVSGETATVEVRAQPTDGRKLYAEIALIQQQGPDARALLSRKGWYVEP